MIAKDLNDRKGAYKLRVVDPRKSGPYKRERLDVKNIAVYDNNYNNMEDEYD